MKYFTIFILTLIISQINIIMGCHYVKTKTLSFDDPNFHIHSLPNIYNWDQMMVFIPVNQDPKYNVADQNNTF